MIKLPIVILSVGILALALTGCKDDPETAYYKNLAAQTAQIMPPTPEQQAVKNKVDSDSVTAQMNTWLGASKSVLLQQMGAPTSTFDDGQGGQIYTYARSAIADDSDPSTRSFYINAQGVIYNTRWRGLWW